MNLKSEMILLDGGELRLYSLDGECPKPIVLPWNFVMGLTTVKSFNSIHKISSEVFH